jgi:hypothetical protein
MTTAADDTADEAAFEAFLAGRPVPAEADGGPSAVVAFAGAVRATATLPGRPNAALADLLTTGLLTDQSSPSTRTAPSAGRSPRRSRIRRRRRFAMFFPALLAKFLSAGALAQAASGAGIALVAFTGAGVAGVLPEPVQETFSSVVGTEAVSDEPTAPEDATGTETDDVTGDVTGEDTSDVVAPAGDPEPTDAFELDPSKSFGEQISGRVVHGEIDGRKVSDWAHDRNEQRKAGTTAAPTDTPEAADDSTDDSTVDSTDDSTDDSAGDDSSEATGSAEVESGSGGHGGGGKSGRGHN